MKIALVSPYDWCVEGGVKTHIAHLADYFRAWGHQVTIYAPASEPDKVMGECEVLGKPWSMRVNGSVARVTFAWKSPEVKEVMAREDFDILHLHEPLMPLLPYHFLRYSNCVTIGTFHAAKEGGNRFYSYTKPITRPWFRKLDGKIAVAHAAANLVSRYFTGYFNIIPNGIDYEHFRQDREPLPEFMDGRPNILFVGRPEKRKGLKYLLRAFILIKKQIPEARLIVVGAGDFSRYEKLVQPEDVVFRSYVPYDQLPRYHRSAHVFCAPNTGGESQGYVLLEAMASGLPVVASNIEGFAGVITDELEGLLVRPKDPQAIATGIMRVLQTPGPSAEMGLRGQTQAAHYSWDNVARRVMSYYERLMYEHQQVADSMAQRAAVASVE